MQSLGDSKRFKYVDGFILDKEKPLHPQHSYFTSPSSRKVSAEVLSKFNLRSWDEYFSTAGDVIMLEADRPIFEFVKKEKIFVYREGDAIKRYGKGKEPIQAEQLEGFRIVHKSHRAKYLCRKIVQKEWDDIDLITEDQPFSGMSKENSFLEKTFHLSQGVYSDPDLHHARLVMRDSIKYKHISDEVKHLFRVLLNNRNISPQKDALIMVGSFLNIEQKTLVVKEFALGTIDQYATFLREFYMLLLEHDKMDYCRAANHPNCLVEFNIELLRTRPGQSHQLKAKCVVLNKVFRKLMTSELYQMFMPMLVRSFFTAPNFEVKNLYKIARTLNAINAFIRLAVFYSDQGASDCNVMFDVATYSRESGEPVMLLKRVVHEVLKDYASMKIFTVTVNSDLSGNVSGKEVKTEYVTNTYRSAVEVFNEAMDDLRKLLNSHVTPSYVFEQLSGTTPLNSTTQSFLKAYTAPSLRRCYIIVKKNDLERHANRVLSLLNRMTKSLMVAVHYATQVRLRFSELQILSFQGASRNMFFSDHWKLVYFKIWYSKNGTIPDNVVWLNHELSAMMFYHVVTARELLRKVMLVLNCPVALSTMIYQSETLNYIRNVVHDHADDELPMSTESNEIPMDWTTFAKNQIFAHVESVMSTTHDRSLTISLITSFRYNNVLYEIHGRESALGVRIMRQYATRVSREHVASMAAQRAMFGSASEKAFNHSVQVGLQVYGNSNSDLKLEDSSGRMHLS